MTSYVTIDDYNKTVNDLKTAIANITTLSIELAAIKATLNKINHLSKLLDVEINDLTEDDILQYSNNGKWQNVKLSDLKGSTNSSSSVTTLGALTDVSITGQTNGQALIYDSSLNKWVNKNVTVNTPTNVDLSGYLTKAEARTTYLPLTGGVINGTLQVNKTLVVKEMTTVEDNILAHGGITMYNNQ